MEQDFVVVHTKTSEVLKIGTDDDDKLRKFFKFKSEDERTDLNPTRELLALRAMNKPSLPVIEITHHDFTIMTDDTGKRLRKARSWPVESYRP